MVVSSGAVSRVATSHFYQSRNSEIAFGNLAISTHYVLRYYSLI